MAYELKRRAQSQEETRRKIVEATIGLHRTVGATGTTISGIAKRAGVGRVTVYRHFPDELSLLQACTGHYFASTRRPICRRGSRSPIRTNGCGPGYARATPGTAPTPR